MNNKPIRLSSHAMEQAHYRGCSAQEILDAIHTYPWNPAELGRLECKKESNYNREWNGKHYRIKHVRPIFVEENSEIVVITVYVYYA